MVYEIMITADWCAKAYGSVRYTSWERVLPETSRGSLFESDEDNSVSSVKIRSGCKLTAYDDNDLNNLIFTYTDDEPDLTKISGHNDRMTSYTCTCNPQGIIYIDFKLLLQLLIIHPFPQRIYLHL